MTLSIPDQRWSQCDPLTDSAIDVHQAGAFEQLGYREKRPEHLPIEEAARAGQRAQRGATQRAWIGECEQATQRRVEVRQQQGGPRPASGRRTSAPRSRRPALRTALAFGGRMEVARINVWRTADGKFPARSLGVGPG